MVREDLLLEARPLFPDSTRPPLLYIVRNIGIYYWGQGSAA